MQVMDKSWARDGGTAADVKYRERGPWQAERTEEMFQAYIKLQPASQTPTRCLVPLSVAYLERPQRKTKSPMSRDYKQEKTG